MNMRIINDTQIILYVHFGGWGGLHIMHSIILVSDNPADSGYNWTILDVS